MTRSSATVARLAADLNLPISRVRLETYRPPNGTDEQMLSTYVWNITLCEALYPALNVLEISLRNTIHQAATKQFGSETWFDIPHLLKRWQPNDILAARKRIEDRGKPQTADRIVAELSFGFWTTVLSRDYHNNIWNLDRAAPLKRAFPHLHGPLFQRHLIHGRFNELRVFRNRVFHFEPIWNHPNLIGTHDRITTAIRWISPTMAELLALIDRFPAIYQDGLTHMLELTLGFALARTI